LQSEIWRVSILVKRLPNKPTKGHRLNELLLSFQEMAGEQESGRKIAEKRIWSIWCDHIEEKARDQMMAGMRQLNVGELSRAENVFDDLVRSYPDWAEAWNKRATVHFLQNRDTMSVKDIYETLSLEPRHFGALSGFSNICVRNGETDAAEIALSQLLEIYPHALGIHQTIATLKQTSLRTMH